MRKCQDLRYNALLYKTSAFNRLHLFVSFQRCWIRHLSVWVSWSFSTLSWVWKKHRRSWKTWLATGAFGGSTSLSAASLAGEQTLICWLQTLTALASGWRISGSFSTQISVPLWVVNPNFSSPRSTVPQKPLDQPQWMMNFLRQMDQNAIILGLSHSQRMSFGACAQQRQNCWKVLATSRFTCMH